MAPKNVSTPSGKNGSGRKSNEEVLFHTPLIARNGVSSSDAVYSGHPFCVQVVIGVGVEVVVLSLC